MSRRSVVLFLLAACLLLAGCGTARMGGKVLVTPLFAARDVVDLPLAATASASNGAARACAASPITSPISLLFFDPVSLVFGGTDYLICRSLVPKPGGTSPWYRLSGQQYFLNTRTLWSYDAVMEWRENTEPFHPTEHMAGPYWSLLRVVYTPVAAVRDAVDVPLASLANITLLFGEACAHSPLTWVPGMVFDFLTLSIGIVDYVVCRSVYPNFWRGVSPWRSVGDPLFSPNIMATWAPEAFKKQVRHSDPEDPRNHIPENRLSSMVLYSITLPITLVTGIPIYVP